ncbi:MAG: lipid-A-disaccharide synthase [Pseudomonadota bacterium]
MSTTPLRVYFIVGEESGDVLGDKLIGCFEQLDQPIEPMGLAGPRMQARGIKSLFDVSEISMMGISAVAANLPKLLRLIGKTANDVIAKNPDVLVLIDSPDFSYRVAKKVRKADPSIRIIKYVAPSVWAWRPGRAKKIKTYIDHVLAILPFEPNLLKELDGPPATYVGHPLAANIPEIDRKKRHHIGDPAKLVLLPGSRHSEVKHTLPFLKDLLEILVSRGNRFEITVPTVGKLEQEIRDAVLAWPVSATVVTGEAARHKAMEEGDLAVAASGTVTLELALFKLPTISIYQLDWIAMRIRHLLTGWTASLPNLIADYPVVPERFNEYMHPEYVARMVERLAKNGEERKIQLDGFDLIEERLRQDTPGTLLAAQTIIEICKK